MTWQPVPQRLNYALILMLVSLLAYSSIGLCISVTPVQAEALSSGEEEAPAMVSCGANLAEPLAPVDLTP